MYDTVQKQGTSRVEESQMKRSEKSDAAFPAICASMFPTRRFATFTPTLHQTLISVVEIPYTTRGKRLQPASRCTFEDTMAFVRRKGNAYYLVHNVRRGGKVQQLHLARLGDRARDHRRRRQGSLQETSLHRSQLALSARTVGQPDRSR